MRITRGVVDNSISGTVTVADGSNVLTLVTDGAGVAVAPRIRGSLRRTIRCPSPAGVKSSATSGALIEVASGRWASGSTFPRDGMTMKTRKPTAAAAKATPIRIGVIAATGERDDRGWAMAGSRLNSIEPGQPRSDVRIAPPDHLLRFYTCIAITP